MAVQPIPAEFKVGTEVTRISGYPDLTKNVQTGTVTRVTKTLCEATFTHTDGRTHTATFVFKPVHFHGKAVTPSLTLKDQYQYSRELDELYLSTDSAVQDAHTHNARVTAQSAAVNAVEALAKADRRWVTREQVEETIAALHAQLADLPTRASL